MDINNGELWSMYLSLNHVTSSSPHVLNETKDINYSFVLDHFQLSIECDECPCPPYSSTGQGDREYLIETECVVEGVSTCSGQ